MPDTTPVLPLFLDIDGVLNDHTVLGASQVCTIDRERMRLLNWILCETDCRIVLVSAWRYMMLGEQPSMNLRGFWYMMRTHGLYAGPQGETNYILGCTRRDARDFTRQDDPHERGRQVHDWLRDHGAGVQAYCCVDDLDLGYTAFKHPFVQTHGPIGLTHWQAGRIINILSGKADAQQP